MAVKQDKISNKAISPSPRQKMGETDSVPTDAAIRLIGRQIAREQFESKIAQERKAQKQYLPLP